MSNMITNLFKLILLTCLLSACEESTQNKQVKRDSRAQLVAAVSVERLSLSSEQQLSGSLTAIRTVKIFNQEQGQIEQLPYFQGDNIKQGDILVYINNDKITALLNKSKASRLQAESNLNRLSKLIKRNLTSDDEVSQARTALALIKAEETINQIRLNDTFIKAPFTGVISERLSEVGDIVPIHTHILSIIDNTKLKIKTQISELLIPQLLLNSKVTIKIDAINNVNNITGTISRIYPTIDPLTRKGTIEVKLDKIPEGAKPGQLTRITIHTPATKRLFLDVVAIQYDNSGEFVYRINAKNRIQRIMVQTGIHIKNKIEIINGLNEKDRIVIEGFSNLKNGSNIKIVNNNPESTQLKSQAMQTTRKDIK